MFVNQFQLGPNPMMMGGPQNAGGCRCSHGGYGADPMSSMAMQMMSMMSMMMSLMAMMTGNGSNPMMPGSAGFGGGQGTIAPPGMGNFLGTGGGASSPSIPSGGTGGGSTGGGTAPAAGAPASSARASTTPTPNSGLLPTGTPLPPAGPLAATGNLRDTNGARPIDAATTNKTGNRSAGAYNSVIDQFDVERNPRYAQRNGNTYCNIFVSDVTRAMGAEIPHWWNGREMDANTTCDWLKNNGTQYGWKAVDEKQAQDLANQGKPVVATWKNPGGIGHVGVVRPGEIKNGPALAQAGSKNVNKAHVKDTFGNANVVYYAHN